MHLSYRYIMDSQKLVAINKMLIKFEVANWQLTVGNL